MMNRGPIGAFFLVVLCLPLLVLSQTAFAQANRGMSVPREKLPRSLGEITPKDFFIPSTQKKVGVVHALEGGLVITHGTTKEAYFAAPGDEIYESDSLATLADSRCRIRFLDEDLVTMGPDTEFSVESFEDQRTEGKKSSFFRMVKGKAMFYAMRLFRYRETRVTLATPTATIGVRGTKFGAHVYYEDEGKVAGERILVADARNEIAPYLAQAPLGPRSFTDCFSEDGVLNVNGNLVPPGQMYSGRTGQVIPTPPAVLQSFRQDTQIRGEGGTGQPPAPQESSSGPSPLGGTVGLPVAVAAIQEKQTTVVQTQVAKETEALEVVTAPTPRRDIGYFAAMLTNMGSVFLEDVFIQFEDHRRYELDTATGLGLTNDTHYIQGASLGSQDLGFTQAPGLKRIYLGPGADSGDLGNTRPISDTMIGRNDYMEWGYWTMTTPVTAGPDQYTIDNRAYYVVGQALDNLDRVRNLGNVTYSGSAYGTYFTPAGGANMTGTFNTNVNFNSGSLTDFNLSVSGGGRAASISGASGSIYDYANLGNNSCSEFKINPATGNWYLNGGAPAINKAAQGTLYGPNGEYIGGVWGMYNNSNEGAAGVFQGSR